MSMSSIFAKIKYTYMHKYKYILKYILCFEEKYVLCVCLQTLTFLFKTLPTSPISHKLALFGSAVNNVWKRPRARKPDVMGNQTNTAGAWHLCF